ncbi:MAG: acyl-CoA dehydrogenase family protein [Candidatus Binataceae bacterium]
MSDIALIEDTTVRTITSGLTAEVIESAERGVWPAALWERLAEQGLTQPAAIAESDAAAEGLEIEAAVLRATATTALPLPVAETALAGWLLAHHGIEAPAGPLSLAAFNDGDTLTYAGGQVTGSLQRVPWGRDAIAIVAIAGNTMVLLDAKSTVRSAQMTEGLNMAGEPRDTLRFNSAKPLAVGGKADADLMLCRCAAARAVQLASAAARALEITVEYATQRQQFGRAIGNFQAIQHQLAAVASEIASAQVAARQAYSAFATARGEAFAAAIAKARANDAAGAVARVAQQVHGAIGYTREYQLQRFTRRIQSWRGEYGASGFWSRRLGELILAQSDRSLWSIITAGV